MRALTKVLMQNSGKALVQQLKLEPIDGRLHGTRENQQPMNSKQLIVP